MHDALGADAREIGGALAVADGVDGAAEGRARQEEDRGDADDRPDPERVGNAEDRSPVARKRIASEAESCGEKPPV